MRYVHTNIVSANWKKLADFYVQTFNCQIVPPIRKQSGKWLDKGLGVQNAKLEGAHLLLPGHGKNGPTLEIYQYQKMEAHDAPYPNTLGFGHIAFEVKDVEETLKILCSNGGKAHGTITIKNIENVGLLTFVYAKDPEGNFIELQCWK